MRPAFLLFLIFVLLKQGIQINLNILHTPILGYAPKLKLHHIVVLHEKNTPLFFHNRLNLTEIYTLDLSPMNQSHLRTQFKLFLGKSVPAEIRIRHIRNVAVNDELAIIEEWNRLNQVSIAKSKELSETTFRNIRNPNIKRFIREIRKFNDSMNLYSWNCQHFSHRVKTHYQNVVKPEKNGNPTNQKVGINP